MITNMFVPCVPSHAFLNVAVHDDIRILQFSAGVDMSMATSVDGTAYAWGRALGGRLGLGATSGDVSQPRRVSLKSRVRAIDVECGYVHSIICGIDGSLHMCGGVGIDGADDGQTSEVLEKDAGVLEWLCLCLNCCA